MTPKNIFLCAAVAIALPIGQSMFKAAALYSAHLRGPLPLRLLTNWPLLAAFGWYAATAMLWFYTLTRVPLSQAYTFSIVGSGLVPLMAWLVFKEPITLFALGGYALMLAGFFIVVTAKAG